QPNQPTLAPPRPTSQPQTQQPPPKIPAQLQPNTPPRAQQQQQSYSPPSIPAQLQPHTPPKTPPKSNTPLPRPTASTQGAHLAPPNGRYSSHPPSRGSSPAPPIREESVPKPIGPVPSILRPGNPKSSTGTMVTSRPVPPEDPIHARYPSPTSPPP
ncbi:hypothetical protein JAAARDRAFT_115178, partial [Jaapia argillacea MUCL 33604]